MVEDSRNPFLCGSVSSVPGAAGQRSLSCRPRCPLLPQRPLHRKPGSWTRAVQLFPIVPFFTEIANFFSPEFVLHNFLVSFPKTLTTAYYSSVGSRKHPDQGFWCSSSLCAHSVVTTVCFQCKCFFLFPLHL